MANLNNWLAFYAGPIILALAGLVIVLLGVGIFTGLRVRRLEKHYQTLMRGADGGNLEQVLEGHIAQVREVNRQACEFDAEVRELQRLNRYHIQHLGFLRFNPFRETGGDQSFVLALTNGLGDGAVISTLHSRDVTRVYAKPLRQWQSTYPLTEEELKAIQQARSEPPSGE